MPKSENTREKKENSDSIRSIWSAHCDQLLGNGTHRLVRKKIALSLIPGVAS